MAQISKPEEFEKILQNAWERIHTCDCQNHGKDGCYHCIYTYSNNRIQDKLSRKRADELFRKILDYCRNENNGSSNWEDVKALGNLSSDGGLEESELEKRFVYALQRFVQEDNQLGVRMLGNFNKMRLRIISNIIWYMMMELIGCLMRLFRNIFLINPRGRISYGTRFLDTPCLDARERWAWLERTAFRIFEKFCYLYGRLSLSCFGKA